MGVPPDEVAMVGDNYEADMRGAMGAGMCAARPAFTLDAARVRNSLARPFMTRRHAGRDGR
eukprot:3060456-Prymnesium_polylepis.1